VNFKKVVVIAGRDFQATINNKGFLIGLLIMPALLGIIGVLAPRILNSRTPQVRGEVAIVDSTGQVSAALRTALEPVPPLCANAPPAAKVSVAAATIAPVLRRRSRLRAWRASLRRARDRRLDSSHGTWFDRSSLGTSVLPPGSWGLRG